MHTGVTCYLAAFLFFVGPQMTIPATHGAGTTSDDTGLTVIPRLEQCELRSGTFTFTPSTRVTIVSTSHETPFPAEYFVKQLRGVAGFPLNVSISAQIPKGDGIVFEYVRDKELGEEGYTLEVTGEKCPCSGECRRGSFLCRSDAAAIAS